MRRGWVLLAVVLAACGSDGDEREADEPADAVPVSDAMFDAGRLGGLDPDWTGAGPRVAVIGDSLVHLTREELHASLDGYAVRVGGFTGEGLARGSWSDFVGTNVLDAVVDEVMTGDPDVVVLAVGTNDAAFPERSFDGAIDRLDDWVDRMASACVVAVAVNEDRTAEGFDPERALAVNEELRELVDEVAPVDPAILDAEGLHPTPAGEAAWAERVAAAVDRCR